MKWPWESEFWEDAAEPLSYTMPFGSQIFGIGGPSSEELSKQQQQRYLQMQQDYLNQIEPNRLARMQALGRTMSLFQPAADVLKEQYGMDFDFGSLLQTDPMTSAESEIATREKIKDENMRKTMETISEAEAARGKDDQVDWNNLAAGLEELGQLGKNRGNRA